MHKEMFFMNLLQEWKKSLLFIKEPYVWQRWRVILGESYGIWWHQGWWLIIGWMVLPIMTLLDDYWFFPFLFGIAKYLVFFLLCRSTYSVISDDERDYSWKTYGKIAFLGALPRILASIFLIGILLAITYIPNFTDFYELNLIRQICCYPLIPFDMRSILCAWYVFYIFELFWANHAFISMFEALWRSFKLVIYSYPIMLLSQLVMFLGLWFTEFTIQSLINYTFRMFCGPLVSCDIKSVVYLTKIILFTVYWPVLFYPVIVSWFGFFYQQRKDKLLQ